jgi:hypothetical protein
VFWAAQIGWTEKRAVLSQRQKLPTQFFGAIRLAQNRRLCTQFLQGVAQIVFHLAQ